MNESRGSTNTTDVGQNKKVDTQLVEISRTFRAPIKRVWEAWSNPEIIKQWWGPESFTSPKAEMDLKQGGKFLFGMESPAGEVNWSAGSVTTLVPNKKIVLAESFSNEQGEYISPKEAGMPNWSGEYHGTITVDFNSVGEDQTKMSIRHTGIPADLHDECVEGWSSSLNKLQKLVERH